MYQVEIKPRDILFFRDGRPIGASDVGHGADWPLPSTFHEALLSAFHERWPDIQPWEFEHSTRREQAEGEDWDQNWHTSSMRFGGLQTAGPFPCREGELHLQTPSDIEADGSGSLHIMKPSASTIGKSNLPAPLTKPVVSVCPPSKGDLGNWIKADELVQYLKGIPPEQTIPDSSIYQSESRPGIAIDEATGTAEEGKFYSSEYLRLRDDVSLTGFARCPTVCHDPQNGKTTTDAVDSFLSSGAGSFVFGGQRGLVRIVTQRKADTLIENIGADEIAGTGNTRVKWVLLSPAVFTKGWIPGFVDPDSGTVQIRNPEQSARISGEKRREWRRRIRKLEAIKANLVAASVPKHRVFSGWVQDTSKNQKTNVRKPSGPKATFRAVPAGAVYYFEAENKEETRKLIQALNGTRRSDLFGEKGFGMGVCGIWNEVND